LILDGDRGRVLDILKIVEDELRRPEIVKLNPAPIFLEENLITGSKVIVDDSTVAINDKIVYFIYPKGKISSNL